MAEASDLERTESPSQRRLDKARDEGQVVRSRELGTFLLLLASAAAFSWMGTNLVQQMSGSLRTGLIISHKEVFDAGALTHRLHALSMEAMWTFVPVLLLFVGVSLAAPLFLGGWLFSVKAFSPDFARLSPLSGLKRMLSTHSLGELLKAVGKSLLVGVLATWVVWDARSELLGLGAFNIVDGLNHLGHLLVVTFFALTGGLAVIAAIDVPLQLWHHHSKLKMTRQEVRDEARESDGDPAVKARIRSLQRESARKRMMAQVPKADVIVTNPTHYAVALSYTESMRAPRVIAKGSALIAQRIRELGREHKIPILEAPPLARALYRHTELGDEIPATLYEAVALVMAYVFQLRRYHIRGGAAPQAPDLLPVPAGMDPGTEQ
jgi:flagellar biosynthetic protein FlhB